MAPFSSLTSPAYRPDPLYMALGADYADPVEPADFPQAIIRFRNVRASASVGLDRLSDADWVAAFAEQIRASQAARSQP